MSLKNKIRSFLSSIINDPRTIVSPNIVNACYSGVLSGKVALVIGGSRGIGYAIAQSLIKEGVFVIITGRTRTTLQQATLELGENSSFVVYDNEDVDNLDAFLDECISIKGSIDLFILNAGISLHEGSFLNVDKNGFERQIKVNFESVYFLAQSIIKRALLFNAKANILLISSETSAKSNDLPYGLSKVAINSLVGGLARRVCQRNIRINAIAPGVTFTQMTSSGQRNNNDYYYPSAAGRYLLPEEIANVAVFLLSDVSSCINGEVVFCDCGNHLKINGFDDNYLI